MNIIVIGCGRVGARLALMLADEGHDVSVLDTHADSAINLGRDFNGNFFKGSGLNHDVLTKAGIEECDVLAAVTSNDNSNMMICEQAKLLFGVEHVICRM
ncbi:MAG: TrkA family potassium uptake protein [Coriobacteriales bacterium]|nr:TrkA family potassium uptake protein [Coriobacteriales bacterium]